MKKLFTLLTMLIVAIGTSWAIDVTDTFSSVVYRNTDNDKTKAMGANVGISSLTLSGDATISSSSFQVASNATGGFTVTTPTGFAIKTITFKEKSSNKVSSLTCSDGGTSKITGPTSKVYTYTATTTINSVTFTWSGNGGNAQINEIVVTMTNDDIISGLYEKISPTGSVSSDAIPFSSSLGDDKVVTSLTQFKGASSSSSSISFGNGKGFTLTTDKAIKEVYFTWIQRSPTQDSDWGGYTPSSTTEVGAAIGTHSYTANKWTAPDENTKSVTFKRNVGNSAQVASIHVIYYPAGPSITTQPQSAQYASGDPISALTVEATASKGDLAYQWYSCDDANRTNAQPIENETNASYTPTAAGFYYVNVKDGNGNIDSDVAQITVSEAEAPTISVSGTPAEAVKVGTEVTLTATATGVPTPTITWYNSSDEPVATEESTELAYTVPTTTAGTYTFYAKASNGVGDDATSAVQTVVVKEQVAKPTITPASQKFTESVTMTASSTTEGAAYVYSVDGGATWNTLPNEGVVFTATTTAQVKATKTDYIDSEVATATYTFYTPTELVTISEATTWDFADLTGGKQFSGDDLNTEFVYTDVDGVGVASGKTFNTDAIAFKGEYPLRSGQKASQNGTLRFNTSVAGTITVEFSDTGTKGDNPPKRYLNVNGVNTEFYTQRTGSKNDKKTSEAIAVPAGDVTITGMDEDGTTARAIMVYKVVFTPFAAQNITVGPTGFATVGLPFATTVPAGVTAYAVESVTDSKVKMSPAIETGTTIPANKGFVIVAAPNTYSFAPVASSSYEGTDILEATGINEKAASEQAPIYVLTITDATNKKIGFKKATTGSLGAYKAYLPGTVSTLTSLSASFDDDPTAVDAIAEANEANAEAPVKVIKNGKLYIGNYNVAGQQVK